MNNATMCLSLHNMSTTEVDAVIIHQFGHALGLGHALMKREEWQSLEQHVHVDKMMESFGIEDQEKFLKHWTGKNIEGSNYDTESVMGY